MFRPLIIALASGCIAAGQPTAAQGAVGDAKPNLVFILADDLGWTDLGCQGSGYYRTPHIDRMADEGMRFTDGYTCGPNCQPTRAALMSGQYGPRTGVYTVGGIDRFDWRSRPLRPVDNVTALPLTGLVVSATLDMHGGQVAFGAYDALRHRIATAEFLHEWTGIQVSPSIGE